MSSRICPVLLTRHGILFLPPANEVCEGYVFTPVCQSFCSRGGGCLPQCMMGYTPLPGSRQPPGKQTTPAPRKQTPPKADHPLCSACWEIRATSEWYDPTGMHTCSFECFQIYSFINQASRWVSKHLYNFNRLMHRLYFSSKAKWIF